MEPRDIQKKFQYLTRISHMCKFIIKFFIGGACHVRLIK